MKKKKGKYLKFYNDAIKYGKMKDAGLCECFEFDGFIVLFEPTYENKDELRDNKKSVMYWGSDNGNWLCYKFTPLRQTIVLFMAAMNNEL